MRCLPGAVPFAEKHSVLVVEKKILATTEGLNVPIVTKISGLWMKG